MLLSHRPLKSSGINQLLVSPAQVLHLPILRMFPVDLLQEDLVTYPLLQIFQMYPMELVKDNLVNLVWPPFPPTPPMPTYPTS
jgi:hypothetical protein